ncbi:MAG: 1-deoxy-D-xylulose-5-phosphate reductoisomerase [Bacteroidales bacterium]|nr:1-deoxy-D-xylulose-5-phosphate reductoisomerase [Bacteroidales bacterium]
METKRKNIAILGSTGSIGTQALDIIRDYPDKFSAEVLVANNNSQLLIAQAREFEPNFVVIANKDKYAEVRDALADLPIKVYAGSEAILDVVAMDCVDMVLAAMVGFAGLLPTIKAIEAGKVVALANKETLVVGGKIICDKLKESATSCILPVDSEHSAIFQCLRGENIDDVEKLILTASGGPFFGKNVNFLKNVTAEQALNHPNWKMGSKVTIDSATLMNKGFEMIEAHWLFGIPADRIEVLVHRQSVVHSMVEFADASIKAQIGAPSMRIPIQYAFDYPNRSYSPKNRFSFLENGCSLTFEKPDTNTFRCLQIAYDCLSHGGNAPCIMNAANEVAVDAFLKGKIGFMQIPEIIENTLKKVAYIPVITVELCFSTDEEARAVAKEMLVF